ncbi:MAG TPA: serine hydrolase domain-containing protein [Caulobacteraceae bacterium]|nr:serine hydrolase domain-containing protein [Caulobacteraceae bacterium]
MSDALGDLAPRCGVPGATVGVIRDGQVHCAAAGVLNLDTQAPVRPESLFQIGSITKVFTAILALQQVGLARLTLDDPVRRVLPGFHLADNAAAASITLRQLLTHTSGMDGDLFVECPAGPDRLARYVELLETTRQLHAPGERFSYCNAGFVLAGRMIEAVGGRSWQAALQADVLGPLGIEGEAGEGSLARVPSRASGHEPDPARSRALKVQESVYALPQTCAPAGTTLTMSVGDLLKLAQALMGRGRLAADRRLLPEELTAEMLRRQMALPGYAYSFATHVGLGPLIYDWDGEQLWGHDGDTLGFQAFLRVHPASGTAMALLTNGGGAVDLAFAAFAAVFPELAGIRPPPFPPARPDLSVNPNAYVGSYDRLTRAILVEREGAGLSMRLAESEEELPNAPTMAMAPVESNVFRFQRSNQQTPSYVRFDDFDEGGKAGTLFSGYRLCTRTEDGALKT